MCGIVGYGGKSLGCSYILTGLKRLEYRGYDSAGVAYIDPQERKISSLKRVGHLENLVAALENSPLNGYVGLGHIRWSTHGVSSYDNAHPQFDCTQSICVVHNGILENYQKIKQTLLEECHIFASDTDTEVIAHLLEDFLEKDFSLEEAAQALAMRIEGSYSIVALLQRYPDHLVALRKGSPLCVGIGGDDFFIASDPLAFPSFVKQVFFMPDRSIGILRAGCLNFIDFDGKKIEYQKFLTDNFLSGDIVLKKEGFEHFMLKEIFEQKISIQRALDLYRNDEPHIVSQLGLTSNEFKNLTSLELIGCGTSWHAALIGQFFFQEIAGISCRSSLASEFRYAPFVPLSNGAYLFISQSGETADTLEALRMVKVHNLSTLALVNVAGSSAAREANGCLLTHSGSEIAVASTKAFSSQIAALYWLANYIALLKGRISQQKFIQSQADLWTATEALEKNIESYRKTIAHQLAPYYASSAHIIFLGRHMSYPLALEAALKLKEIAYIVAEAYPAGELKHGPIALIDKNTPVIIFSSLNSLIYRKLVSNAQEVKARHGHLCIFAFEGDEDLINIADTAIVIPRVPDNLDVLAFIGVVQYFVYEIARFLERPIDKPRNLAKSVTVE